LGNGLRSRAPEATSSRIDSGVSVVNVFLGPARGLLGSKGHCVHL
jgi:hypothetical protein